MAIAFDAASADKRWGSGATTYTQSHTCTGSNLGLFVVIQTNQAQNVTGITYAGVAMTLAKAETSATYKMWVYYLASPATGANDIVATFSASCSYVICNAVSLTGVNTSALLGATNSAYNNTAVTTRSINLTTTVDNSWILVFDAVSSDGGTIASDADYTQRASLRFGFSQQTYSRLMATAGADTYSGTMSTNLSYDLIAIEVKVMSATPSGPAHLKKFNGVPIANIKKINGVAIANIKKINSVA